MTNLDDDEDDVAELEADQDEHPKVEEHKNLKSNKKLFPSFTFQAQANLFVQHVLR